MDKKQSVFAATAIVGNHLQRTLWTKKQSVLAATAIEKHTWKKKQRGKREEKKKKRGILAAEILGIVICSITNRRERGMGGILLTNCKHSGLNLEEGEEGEGERKVASDNELNFRYFNGCI
ncbi:uncharacterized protein LOC112033878 isoform X2 [Quercus suber]|uniref:uncharacterized protein LOC112033878 isoform X2 n=1 Tax=Quercus suber TaxID=58331 RepID=UPI0032DEFF48